MRARRLTALGAAVAALGLPTSAPAFTGSEVTSPADGLYQVENDAPTPIVTIAGTVDGAVTGDKADLVCVNGQSRVHIFETDVDVSGGSFSVGEYRNSYLAGTCRIHAIPTGVGPLTIDLSPYDGPLVTTDYRETYRTDTGEPSPNVLHDYFTAHQRTRGFADFLSIGSCGLCDAQLFDDATKQASEYVFWGNGAWSSQLAAPYNRSSVQIDGTNAWASHGASKMDMLPGMGYQEANTVMTGAPGMALTQTGERSQDLLIDEAVGLVVCDGPGGWPPTKANCGNWKSGGVMVRRTIRFVREGTLVLIEDVFTSTDGAEHQLDLLWFQAFRDPPGTDPAQQFPWVSDEYKFHAEGDDIAAPPAGRPASVYTKTDISAPDGDFRWAQGLIVFDTPTGDLHYTSEYVFQVPMQRTVPATGAVTIRQAYAMAKNRAELAGVQSEVEDLYAPPTVAFTFPDDGATVPQAELDVRGTANNDKALPAVTLNGQAVTVAPDGTWTHRVTLSPGENTLTATARDAAGNEVTATRRVIYTPPPPLPPPLDAIDPVLSSVSMTNRRFAVAAGATAVSAAAKRGTRVRYSLSEPATVTFAIARARPGRRVGGRCRRPTRANRSRRRCTRFVKVGRTIRRASPGGRSTLRFTGRIGRRALRRGRHRMAVVATDAAGNRSKPRRLRFRIVRR